MFFSIVRGRTERLMKVEGGGVEEGGLEWRKVLEGTGWKESQGLKYLEWYVLLEVRSGLVSCLYPPSPPLLICKTPRFYPSRDDIHTYSIFGVSPNFRPIPQLMHPVRSEFVVFISINPVLYHLAIHSFPSPWHFPSSIYLPTPSPALPQPCVRYKPPPLPFPSPSFAPSCLPVVCDRVTSSFLST